MKKRARRRRGRGNRAARLGYKLSSEEQGPRELVPLAAMAEEHGFSFALLSDHFHPWTDRQGQSPFVWSVIGGIAQATWRLARPSPSWSPRKRWPSRWSAVRIRSATRPGSRSTSRPFYQRELLPRARAVLTG